MKLEEVPQDTGMIDSNRREVCYAVDKEGHYVMAPSAGWEPKKVANDQAWDMVRKKVEAAVAKIRAGKLSPLAYHMARNQMGVGLLAKYVRSSRLKVWWHLRPKVFERLTNKELEPYADLFDLKADALKNVPDANCANLIER
ncbi:MAG: hypothetical protein PVJ84_11105 [Desulfobacteraceae bacterium]